MYATCVHFVLLYLILPFTESAHSQSWQEIEERIKQEAGGSIAQSYGSSHIGKSAGAEYKKGGPNWDDRAQQYKEHVWAKGNPNWEKVWKEQDTATLLKGFPEWLLLDDQGKEAGKGSGPYGGECYQYHVISCCDLKCKIKLVGYWWPEAVVTLNNFCISSYMGPDGTEFRGNCDSSGSSLLEGEEPWPGTDDKYTDTWVVNKDLLLKEDEYPPKTIDYKLIEEKVKPIDQWPDPELREHPHNRQSHTAEAGFHAGLEQYNYEAHVFRPYLDILANEGKFHPTPPGKGCFAQTCASPHDVESRFAKWWTEDSEHLMPALWRIPELSQWRPGNTMNFSGQDQSSLQCNLPYAELWSGVPEYSMLPGLDGKKYSQSGRKWKLFEAANYPKVLSAAKEATWDFLKENTCASFRRTNDSLDSIGFRSPVGDPINPRVSKERLPLDDMPNDPDLRERAKRNCFSGELGQLYPLTGQYSAASWRFGTVLPALRMLEWTSLCYWDERRRTNHFSHWGGALGYLSGHDVASSPKYGLWLNIARWIEEPDFYFPFPLPPDKLQRLYPIKGNSDTCFTAKEVNRLDPSASRKFPKGLYEGNFLGETRYAFWNFRTCCVSDPSSEGSEDEGAEEAEETEELSNICIPLTE